MMSIEIFDVLVFRHNIVENVDITTTDPDWTDLMTLSVPDMSAGLYALSFSLKFNMHSTTKSFMYRFSVDGGVTWGITHYKEAKDKTDIQIIEVFDLIQTMAVGTIDIRCQVTREANASCVVEKGIISFERKA